MMCQRSGRPPISTIGLGLRVGFFGDARAEAAGKNDCFHVLLSS